MKTSAFLLALCAGLTLACAGQSEAEPVIDVPEDPDAEVPAEAPDDDAVERGKGGKFSKAKGRKNGKSGARTGARTGAGATTGPASIDVSGMPLAPGAAVDANSARVVTKLKTSDCIHTTITPLVIGDQIVFGTHKQTARGKHAHCNTDNTPTALFAVSGTSGEARVLMDDVDAEGAPVFAEGVILMPLVGSGGGIASWYQGQSNKVRPVKMGMDSAALWDPKAGHLVVGTINPPSPMCQKEPNPNCGVLMTLNRDGTVKKIINRESGFRAWVAAGPTSDGTHYYVGGGSGMDGARERTDTYACDMVKLDSDLNVLGRYDDGVPGCRDVGKLKSAPIGEMPVTGNSVWAQYLGATADNTDSVPFIRLNKETMKPICRAEIPAPGNRSLSGFYTGPVVDERDRAYFVSFSSQGRGLFRVNSDCSYDALYTSQSGNLSSPALADDRYVLIAEAGNLLVIDRENGRVTRHRLGSSAGVTGSPVIHDGGVTVVADDGTVTTFKDLGITGYGKAPWPRFRKDNLGGAGAW